MKRRIVAGGILALSLAVVLLAATASSASARFLAPWYCPPPPTAPTAFEQSEDCLDSQLHPDVDGVFESCLARCSSRFDFGDRQVGTTSPAQRFALVFERSDVPQCVPACPEYQTFTPRISVSGDYVQTNNCQTLSPTGPHGCIITVTFAPTGSGRKDGTLSTGTDASVFEACRCPAATGPTVALSGSGVTTPTPPALPLLLSARVNTGERTLEKLTLNAITNNDSTLVARGGVMKTTKQLKGGEKTKFQAKPKHLKRLGRRFVKRDKARVKFKFAATDEFGQTATEKFKVTFCRRVIPTSPACDRH